VTPRVVILAAPSGGGKTTIAKELLRRFPASIYRGAARDRLAPDGARGAE